MTDNNAIFRNVGKGAVMASRFANFMSLCAALLSLPPVSGCGHSRALSTSSQPAPNQTFTVTVTLRGPGAGRVTSNPAGIDCGTTCSASFITGTMVSLTAISSPSPFVGWSGDPACSSGLLSVNSDMNCTATFNPGPSKVFVSGTQLVVQKRNVDGSLAPPVPFVLRGAVWSPASANTNTTPRDPNNATVRRSEFAKWANTDVPLIASMNANTVRLPIDPGSDLDTSAIAQGGWDTLNLLYKNNIMVIMTVDDAIGDTTRITHAVNYYKNHPAVLMFSLGSEWNVNFYFGKASSVMNAAALTEQAAQTIKSLDTNHPVATSYADIDIDSDGLRLSDTGSYVTNICPSIDVWGLNVFRGDNFGLLFQQWASITTKPMFVGEFGIDAFHTSTPNANPPSGQIDEAEQASWNISLWNDLLRNVSAFNSQGVALGGTVFEFQDEWWKCSPTSSQSTCGFPSGGFPDGFSNETYFGLSDIYRRGLRQAYGKMKIGFAAQYNPGPQQVTFQATSSGYLAPAQLYFCTAGGAPFGFSEFDKGHTLLFRVLGDGCGGRGFSIAAIAPSTGDLLAYPASLRTFDTWRSRETGGDMEKMIDFIKSLPDGTILLMSVADDAGLNPFPGLGPCSSLPYPWVTDALQLLRSLGSRQIQNYCYGGSWAMITVKGEGAARAEQVGNPGAVSVQATFTIP